MQRIGVLVHPTRPVDDGVEVLRRFTEERGLQLVQIAVGEQPAVAPPGQVSACDLVAALGGDGTVLKALHAAARTRTPVLGVAYGSLGVLTALATSRLRAGLHRFVAGDWQARHLPALDVDVAEGRVGCAINDLVLVRRGRTQLMVDVCVDGELYVRLAGDGVVVATPLGSSAYSMAAGGSLLAAASRAVICTPLAMHGGCAPPLVVPDDRQITLALHPAHGGFDVEIDGFAVQTAALRFTLASEPGYATLVGFADDGGALRRLRERGLIADSPRVLARDRQATRGVGAG